MKIAINVTCSVLLMAATNVSIAECFGSGEYRVCSESYTDAMAMSKSVLGILKGIVTA